MRLEPESNSSVPQATEFAIIGQNPQPSSHGDAPIAAETATKEPQFAAPTHPLAVLQRLRAQQPPGSEPYRILEAAINHVIGFRPSSVGPEYDEEAL